jgi:hypothetical protein
MLSEHYRIPLNLLLKELESEKSGDDELGKWLEGLNLKLLYLPTYRRIEQELKMIFQDGEQGLRSRYPESEIEKILSRNKSSSRRDNSFVELVEFGMKDVDEDIKRIREELKEFARKSLDELSLGYLRDIIENQYSTVDIKQIELASNDTIEKILNRINEPILSHENKKHLLETIQSVKNKGRVEDKEHPKVVCHYFIKLLDFQKKLQEEESKIRNFCEICNKYLIDKICNYDSVNFEFSINTIDQAKSKQEIKLHHLSSGEKQIVSLFSHLYFSGNEKYLVLIDEPELSLSVPWQRKFLIDIKNSNYCSGLIAVTHSPFIYDNDLKSYARGIGEFVT